MKKTYNINLNGQVFCIDDDACLKLQSYIDTLESHYLKEEDGREIMADIESRIAELLKEVLGKGYKQVVTMEDIDQIIRIMGSPDVIIDEDTDKSTEPIKRKLHMFPMDYEEFRWALGDTTTIRLLQGCFHDKTSLGDATNRKLMRDFRLYMLVGGMPQAVVVYLETNNLEKVDSVKRSIITLYEDDFNKIDPTGNASKIFRQIPAQLTGNANRYLAWSATDGTRNSALAEILSEVRESMVVNMAYHANDPSVGMALHQDPNKYKMFAGDTGLFVTLAFWDSKFTDNTIYHKLLADKLSTDLGYVYENVVAQMLKASGHELYYYTFPTGSGKHNYEVDFLIADGDKVSPVEVKSSGYKAHTSLDAFCGKFSSRIRNKYLVYTKDMRKDGDVLYLPVYMTMFL